MDELYLLKAQTPDRLRTFYGLFDIGTSIAVPDVFPELLVDSPEELARRIFEKYKNDGVGIIAAKPPKFPDSAGLEGMTLSFSELEELEDRQFFDELRRLMSL